MKSKIGLIVLIVLIVIVAGFAWCASAGIGGNKVTVTGTVYFNAITGWGVTYNDVTVVEDSFISVPTLWYFPWETKDINIIVEMSNGKEYSADGWTGKINLVLGSTSFSADLRHVANGVYSGKVFVYEVEKGLLWGEKTRVLQASTSFNVNI